MDDIPLGALFGTLVALILLSAFFSASEIAMVSLNRHRLRHLAGSGHRGALLASRLLARPDRLIGVILLGSNFVNAAASTLATVTAIRLIATQETAIAVATVVITLVVLIFTDLAPKTLAALYPERIAFLSAYVLLPLLRLIYPLVWTINLFANGLLRLLGVRVREKTVEQVTTEELKTIIAEAGRLIPEAHQDMLLAILDMQKLTVDDVMVPRAEIEGIDLDDDWQDIVTQLATSHHTRLPVYRGSLDQVVGILHLRRVLHLSQSSEFNKETLQHIMREPYFIPEGTPLHQELLNMQAQKRRLGLVVNEYGDIKGLLTLDVILEEIVGEFTTQAPGATADVYPQADGSFLVSGAANIRDLNRKMDWDLPADGPKTLNGLILEYLEDIPEPGTSLRIAGYAIEVVQTRGAVVRMARIWVPAGNKEEPVGS